MTNREQDILEYIIEFKKVNGYSPTAKEIMEGVNTKSVNYVSHALDHLMDEGYISMKPRSPRTIVVKKFIC